MPNRLRSGGSWAHVACFGLAFLLLAAGCSPPEARRTRAAQSGRAAELAKWQWCLTATADYYLLGPQQARPPDGALPPGTPVEVLDEAGSYVRVRGLDGKAVYVAADAVAKVDLPALARAGRATACDLYRRLAAAESGSLCFSPLSLATALAMTWAGAGGTTRDEMTRVLHFDGLEPQVNQGFGLLRAELDATARRETFEWNLANRLWGQSGVELSGAFLELTRTWYGAELGALDFRRSEAARATINDWVARQTAQRIRELLPSGSIDQRTRLVLTNAVYFKAPWMHPFEPAATRDAAFERAAGDTVEVPFMRQTGSFAYAADEAAAVVELPYARGGCSLLVVLPQKRQALAQLEARLDERQLADWFEALAPRQVSVSLPRLKFSARFSLAQTLEALGMRQAFVPGEADFQGMSAAADEWYISGVFHEAALDVDEAGTEAAAATGVTIGVTSAPPQEPVVFLADHPFLFLIRDRQNNSLLFLGRVVDPSAKEARPRAG